MIGTVYEALNVDTGLIEKIGSTIHSLKKREKEYCRKGNYKLSPIYVGEYEDSPYGVLLLRAREESEITKRQLWMRDGKGGRNIMSPVNVWFSGVDDQQMRSYAGSIGGRKTFELHGNPRTEQGCIRGGIASGKKNAENGHMSAIGKIYGGRYGHILAEFRTVEHQVYAGKKGGFAAAKVNAESGWSKNLGSVYGPENARKIPYEIKMKALIQGRHNRWHVKRGTVSSTCALCTQKEAV